LLATSQATEARPQAPVGVTQRHQVEIMRLVIFYLKCAAYKSTYLLTYLLTLRHTFKKFHQNSSTFWAILLRDKPTNAKTLHSGQNYL